MSHNRTHTEDYLTCNLLEHKSVEPIRLNQRYGVPGHQGFYFVVRKDEYDARIERVCLYQEGVVNIYLRGNDEPYTAWVSNEPLEHSTLADLLAAMTEKAENAKVLMVKKAKRYE